MGDEAAKKTPFPPSWRIRARTVGYTPRARGAQRLRSQPAFIIILAMKLVSVRSELGLPGVAGSDVSFQ
jgi:hypothetical protein